jgi:hypothetical protein
VSAHTLRRWRLWWQTTLVASRFWRAACGQFRERLNPRELPQALLDRFGGDARERMHGLLRFMAPISGGAADRERVP